MKLRNKKLDTRTKAAVFALSLICLNAGGCTTAIGTNSFCDVYEPLLPSRHDTEETIRHLKLYADLYDEVCLNE